MSPQEGREALREGLACRGLIHAFALAQRGLHDLDGLFLGEPETGQMQGLIPHALRMEQVEGDGPEDRLVLQPVHGAGRGEMLAPLNAEWLAIAIDRSRDAHQPLTGIEYAPR